MPVYLRKRIRLPLVGNWYFATLSKSGASHTLRLWPLPVSWNSRNRHVRVDLPGMFSWSSRSKYTLGGFLFRWAGPFLVLVSAGLGAGVAWSGATSDQVRHVGLGLLVALVVLPLLSKPKRRR